ncbi:nonstructural protein [Blackfly microvirus SF02]|uniref:Nonstructural protein n=1 Tax=Blackfly microvirus SF02 TaxID=2576452 RepID=A0A4P8PKB9_9VIRU|nr:nonstructural protein [Blackfly microvirus SF02]
MILGVYSVFDNAAKAYLPPIFFRSKGEAVRGFVDAINSDGHQFQKHASDYALFELGSFDDSNGFVQSFAAPIRVMSAHEAVPSGS